jgi:hypothetical protein
MLLLGLVVNYLGVVTISSISITILNDLTEKDNTKKYWIGKYF